jgi:hypothetical protein
VIFLIPVFFLQCSAVSLIIYSLKNISDAESAAAEAGAGSAGSGREVRTEDAHPTRRVSRAEKPHLESESGSDLRVCYSRETRKQKGVVGRAFLEPLFCTNLR